MSPPLDLSLVIPCHNEEKNLQPLVSAIHGALDSFGIEYEIMITDNASTDDSWRVLKELAGRDPRLRIQRFEFNCGESAASGARMQASRRPIPRHARPPICKTTRRICRRCSRHSKMRTAFAESALPPAAKATIGFVLFHRALRIGCETSCPAKRSATLDAPIACSSANASRA